MWLLVRRSKELPEGGNFGERELEAHREPLRRAIEFASSAGELKRAAVLAEYWAGLYHDLGLEQPGMLGELTSRTAQQVMRLATTYAVLDRSPVIEREHLVAANALWRYSDASCAYVFAGKSGDPMRDAILAGLEKAHGGLTRTEVSALFGRNVPAAQLETTLVELKRQELIKSERETTGSRPTTRYLRAQPDGDPKP
jgi:DNA replicative helicase MCM subunit Mcm2 (Cdc46/Mcm family)